MRSAVIALLFSLALPAWPSRAISQEVSPEPSADLPGPGWDCTSTAPGGAWDCRAEKSAGPAVPSPAPPPPIAQATTPPESGRPPATGATAPLAAPPPSAGPAPVPTPRLDPALPGPATVPPPPALPLPPEESTAAPAPPGLPPLVPSVDLSPQDYTGPSPWVLPPRDFSTPSADTPAVEAALGPLPRPGYRGEDLRLYRDLPWDFCGPRVGTTGFGSTPEPAADPRVPVDVAADRAEYDRRADLVQLRGGVDIVQGDQRLTAERADYDRRSGDVSATGDVYVEYPGARLEADTARYNLTRKEGALTGVRYRLAGDANLRGTAEQAELLPGKLTRYRDVTYTTCPPGRSDWSLRASDLLLDHPKGLGTARNARVRLADIPVLYTPWLQFPIDDRRRSGLLVPSVGNSNQTGLDVTIPYYWNIAPNMDATFFPRWMSERGVMLGAQVRHLASFGETEIESEVLPEDSREPDLGVRGAVRVTQAGSFAPRWYTAVDAAAVSDDNYLSDFGNRLDVTSVRNLPQRADLLYGGDGFAALARLQDFQTVDPTIPPQDFPYAQLPHFELDLAPRRTDKGLEYDFEGRYDYFDHNAKVHGSRLVALPSVRLPLRRSYGYLIPRGRVFYTGYELIDTDPGVSARQSHLIPSLDVDSKLIFERDTSWLGTSALQTLEPRLYYVLTPYTNQDETPLFDTTELDFSFASLFRPNRFTGYDRVGDENRLTLALTSRTLASASGRELFRASIGQIYFFQNQEVQITPDVSTEDRSSSVAGELGATLGAHWDARASAQWNPNASESPWEKRVFSLRYAPDPRRILNLAYRFDQGSVEAERYENTDISFRLPVTDRVQVVGRWLYSLLDADTVEAFAGIELGRCCWRLRVLARHLKTATAESGSTSVMLQLELAGLGALGSSIDTLLEHGIYGYRSE